MVLLVRYYGEGNLLAEETQKIADFLVAAWKDVGIEIDAQLEDLEAYNDRIRARDYDLLVAGQSLGYNLDTYSYWHSSQSNEAGLNLSNYRSFAADSLIERIRNTFDRETKEELLGDLAEVIAKDVPAIFLYRPSYVFASDDKVQGVQLTNLAFPSDRFINIADWCIFCE